MVFERVRRKAASHNCTTSKSKSVARAALISSSQRLADLLRTTFG